MVEESTYGRTLDFQGNSAECPPEDIYTFRITKVPDPILKDLNQWGNRDIQVNARAEIINYLYDENDSDDFDWNGYQATVFIVLGRIYKGKEDQEPAAVWKSEKSNSYPIVKALFPEWDWTGGGYRNESIDLDAMEGRRFRAKIEENDKGYPRLTNFMSMPTRTKGGKVAQPAPKPEPVIEDPVLDEDEDDADMYDDI